MTDANPFAKGGAAVKTKPEPKVETKPEPEPAGFDTAAANGEVKKGKAGDPFSLPSGGGSEVKITEFVGELMLVKPTEFLPGFATSFGETDTIRADVTFLTGERQGETEEEMLIFQRPLVRALKKVHEGANPYLLGRLGKGTARQGQSAPYIFEVPEQEDITLAQQYLAAQG